MTEWALVALGFPGAHNHQCPQLELKALEPVQDKQDKLYNRRRGIRGDHKKVATRWGTGIDSNKVASSAHIIDQVKLPSPESS